MTKAKTNRIQYFVFISMTFHLVLFLLWSTLAHTKSDTQNLEVFIVSQVSNTENQVSNQKKSHKIKIENQAKTLEMTRVDNEDIKKDFTHTFSIPQKSEPTEMSIESTSTNKSSSSSKSKLTSDEGSERIIETSFGAVNGPKFLYREIPVYPQIARRLGKEGKVVLRLTIDERGELQNIEILESAPYGFTEAAVEAVRKSKFSPALKDGRPVASKAILPIRFILKN